MGIIGKMTAFTTGWRAFEAVYVALFARHIHMLAFEREVSQTVVKRGRFPANGCVA